MYNIVMRKAILCFLKRDNQVLLLKTAYTNKIVWNGVSGYIESGEKSTQAACREIMEEIGVQVVEADLHSIGHYDIFEIFYLEKWQGEPESKEESIKDVRWFPRSELPWDQMHVGNEKWLPSFLDLIK